MADLLENLNERQREAVLATEGYVRVIAGAGSGKTKLLVSRYAYLVQDYGIDASNILCVTFTNKAAGEMKKRIRALIGGHNDTSLICTYHGFCNHLLRENPEKLFLNKQFQIIDTQQQKAVLGEIYQKFELKLDYASFESILRKIAYVKKDTGYVTRLCNPKPCQILPEIKDRDDRMIEEFLQRQKATYSLDFHDLISFAIYLLETDSEVREKWQNRLNYIMVDEFQDSSAVEMRLVELLSGMFQNLMIVGDPDQNIYEWRGSDVKLLVDFDKEHKPTKTIILNQNYRSTPQILNCANSLIEKNELRLKKDLFTKNASGAPVVHYHSKNDFDEMDRVIENIRRLHDREGLNYSDVAIIYRSGFLSRVAEKKLVEKNVPYEIFGGVRFYQRMEILDILAYLKLIAYDDDTSFRRIVNTPRRRFGRAKMNLLEKLQKEDSEENTEAEDSQFTLAKFFENDEQKTGSGSLFATLSAHLSEREFLNSDAASFVHFIETMRTEYRKKRIPDIVNEVAEKSGYEGYIRELGDEERLDNLSEFKRIANEFEREFGENLTLEQFLEQLALQSGEDTDEAKDTVKLMTIHSSKGLEFPAVFILGFTEGIFPSAKTIGERKKLGLEEERRLCYVAMTRAEQYLFLMDSEGTSPNGIKKLVSRFLEEIGEQNYVRIGQISDELRRESRGYAAKLNSGLQGEQQTKDKKAGDEVEHHIFGKGRIESVDEKRGSYLVRFDGLKQARNISRSYFIKAHEVPTTVGNVCGGKTADCPAEGCRDAGQKTYGGQAEDTREVKEAGQLEKEGKGKEAAKGLETEEIKIEEKKKIDAGEIDAEPWRGIETSFQDENKAANERKGEKINVESGRGIETDFQGENEAADENKGVKINIESGRGIETGFQGENEAADENKGVKINIESGRKTEISEVKTESKTKSEKETFSSRLLKNIEARIEARVKRELDQAAGKAETKEEIETKFESKFPDFLLAETSQAKPAICAGDKIDSDIEKKKNIDNARAARLKELKENSLNLWKHDEVPHTGWTCTGVSDLGEPIGICGMCGYQIIRYAHHMEHPGYRSLSVGCVCAGRMEGDPAGAKRRESEFKNRQARRVNFLKRKWKQSKKGNEYLKIDEHVVVLYHNVNSENTWKYSIDNEFCRNPYTTREKAVEGAFEALERLKGKENSCGRNH